MSASTAGLRKASASSISRQIAQSLSTANPMTFTHTFHPTILREYDIRGIVGETLSTADAEAVGRGFGTAVRRAGGRRVCVGYDGRISSPDMEAAVVTG